LETRIALFGENNFLVAWSYHNAGVVYLKKSDYEKALEYSIKALTIRLQVYNENHPEVAWSYNNIGGVYIEMEEYDKALEFLQKALSLRIKIFGENNPAVAYTLKAIGVAYLKQNKFEQASDYYQKAIISLVADFNDSNIYVNPPLLNASSEIYLLNTLADKAKAFKERYSLKTKDVKDIQMSLSTSELASKLIDKLRYSYEAEQSKLFLGETVLKIYDQAIETALELYELTKEDQYKETAFLLAEKSKAGVLLGALQESKAKLFAAIPESCLQKNGI
jgi:tetratricopeptide (TPR) repeat protein